MFGYITIDPKSLGKEERGRYRAAYCGLCRRLGEKYGFIGKASLAYDLTFVAILLSSLYGMEESSGMLRCAPHPLRKHCYVVTAATEYAADMNIVLAYYKCLDDIDDDHSFVAVQKAKLLKKYIPRIESAWRRQCKAIENSLKRLDRMEKEGVLNPDIPANCFGELMGELFVLKEDEYAPVLRRMGAALGSFIYLLDAHNDLRADIKRRRYNPLVSQLNTDILPVLTLIMGECTAEFEKLPFGKDLRIMRNILYSGVWTGYKLRDGKAEAL